MGKFSTKNKESGIESNNESPEPHICIYLAQDIASLFPFSMTNFFWGKIGM